MRACYLRAVCTVLLSLPLCQMRCYSADVVFIHSSALSQTKQRELETSAQFYGLNLVLVAPSTDEDDSPLARAIERETTAAVVIAANALGGVKEQVLFRAMNRRAGGSVPLLIFDVTPKTDPTLLRSWSGGAAIDCRRLEGAHRLRYVIGGHNELTQQLADVEFRSTGHDSFYFDLRENSRSEQIMNVRDDGRSFPVFIQSALPQLRVFLECATQPSGKAGAEWNAEDTVHAFAKIAPMMMFLRYSAGDKGWHSPYHYANLTIDDPWLREPYGCLSYRGLLAEMDKHNFHSTIAFIPWNYDRSEAGVVSLIRNHPDRFSICVHGDNHDHKEFTDYKDKPLSDQVDAIKQSLARMDKFQRLTGIPYDRVMVYPHSMAPEKTLEALKTYNYRATVNSLNVPMDRPTPSNLLFSLRPITVSFADFASIQRYSVAAPISADLIAVNAFLGNPLFFYCHQDFFASGINAFDGIADKVNKLEPDMRWGSVGEIAKHLYLLKLRDDSGYDVRALSSDLCLSNASQRNAAFYVQKQENGTPAVASVSIDNERVPFRLDNGYLDLETIVPAGKARCVVINYKNDLTVASVSTAKDSVRIYLLRMASDFRDITLSGSGVGRVLTRFYYKNGLTPKQILLWGLLLMVSSVFATGLLWVMIARYHRRQSAAWGASARNSLSHF